MIRDQFRVLHVDLATGKGNVLLDDGRDAVVGGSGLAARLFARFGRADAPAPALLRFVALSGSLRRRVARF